MIWKTSTLVALLLTLQHHADATPTWPASTDELEDIMLLNSGYRARGFATAVTPCSAAPAPGRNAAAEWIRTAFHDMATGNKGSGVGGLDASIVFETKGSENIGPAFLTTLSTYAPFLSSRTSMADIIAMGVYTATRSCGGPVVPVRGGRVDATRGGGIGVPLPENAIGTFKNQFLRMGYNTTEMIQFTACGHSFGGVHQADFPTILDKGDYPNDYAVFDTTPTVIDNRVVTEYLDGTTKNPLVVGKSISTSRNSDTVVYNSDGNVTIGAMADAQVFANTCKSMFQKMIEFVPSGVKLTEVITPYEIKPYALQLTLLDGGSKLNFTGDIRVRMTQRSANSISQIQLVYRDRTGVVVSTPITASTAGSASGFDDTFQFYSFSAQVPADTSISSFNVVITTSSGTTETWDNNSGGFPVDDTIIYQTPQSCLDAPGKLTVVAAVRNGASFPSLKVVVKNPRATPIVVPSMSTATAAMSTQSAVGAYQLYSASYTFSGSQAQSAVFGVFAGSSSDNYKNASFLPSSCGSLAAVPSTSTSPWSSTVVGTSISSAEMTAVVSTAFTTMQTPAVPIAASSSSSTSTQAGASSTSSPTVILSTTSSLTSTPVDSTVIVTAISTFQSAKAVISSSTTVTSSVSSNYGALSSPISTLSTTVSASSTTASANSTSSSISSSTPTSTLPTLPGYNYTGCMTDSTSDRTFTAKAQGNANNTYESCSTFCNGYMYFGVEYGAECYCGNALPLSAIPHPDSECNMPCAGNSKQVCGAGGRLTVFESLTLFPVPANPVIPGYTYQGCMADSVQSRVLGDTFLYAHNMTVPMCSQFCSGKKYFGVEYGDQCYCGDVLGDAGGKKGDRECAMGCPGDQSSFCGAGDRIGVWGRS
jgi:hypothetical protein